MRQDVRVADDERDDLTSVNRATYDRIAGLYAANQTEKKPTDGRWFPDLEHAFLQRVPPRGLLADLGCGPGSDGARFTRAGFRVVGMDLSTGMLTIAARSLRGRVAQADLRALPIQSGRLDGIWCSAALLHVPEEDTARVLRQFRVALRPSGSLALVTALGEAARLEPVPYAPEQRRWFIYRRADRLRQQLREAGFGIRVEEHVTSNREWVTVLAGAV
jgi:SAM-dependent methyltransferase